MAAHRSPAARRHHGGNARLGDLLEDAERRILASRQADLWKPWVARADAEEIAELVLGREIGDDDLDQPLNTATRGRLQAMFQRRIDGEPLAMIRGWIDFRGLRLTVRGDVFTPRPSSELLATEAIRRLRRRRRPVAVDVATGAGPVALAVGDAVPGARVIGLDIAASAVSLARSNARRLAVGNVEFRRSDLLAGLPRPLRRQVDVITFHPPYVAGHELKTLPGEISRFEPVESLTDRSSDGLGLVRRLADEATAWLRPGGWVLVEVGPYLARSATAVLRRGGIRDLRSLRDGLAVTRVVAGQAP